jgi:type I restriction enzyme R subunit
LYFANPGIEERFQEQFYFHWEDFIYVIVRDWKQVATNLLSIPMAHQMVGFYTIADDKDKTLKVLRSYQYFATSKISDVVNKTNWDDHLHRGGYVWHTTGSGKTMTSFKSAELIAKSGDADKVIFLLDRIELALQSLDEYRGFAGESDAIQDTADTSVLLSKLKSTDTDDRLIVTSIQKMSNIKTGSTISQELLDKIGKKRLVFIIDECHRSVFGDMLISIKHTFPRALLFGFTGTPVFEENAKNEITTETLFGDMLHKYTIASGIPDKNVLGFDPYMVNTYDDDELCELVAFHQIDLKLKDRNPDEPLQKKTTEEYMKLVSEDEELGKIYDKFVNKLQMPETYTENGKHKRCRRLSSKEHLSDRCSSHGCCQ